MASNDYRFATVWMLRGTIEEAAEVLEDVESLPHWWPAVYLGALVDEPGDAKGIGKTVRVLTRGWLPYQLRWTLRVAECESPRRFVIDALGDLAGRGEWNLRQAGEFAELTYDWQVRANKPLLRVFGFALAPLFAMNHRWAMAKGQRSLELEMRRRRALREGRLERVPMPPGPAMYSGPLLIGIAALILIKLAASARRRSNEDDEA